MPLRVYKASAGSGKTYRLTKEYLKLLFTQSIPKSYRTILAVTFTNKATEEMKTRILQEINDLASGDEQKLKTFYDELQQDNHLRTTENEKELSKDVKLYRLQQQAIQLRSDILHDYSQFSILTIDKFFHRILQSFIREANIDMGYEIELDSTKIVEFAVEKALENALLDKDKQKIILNKIEELLLSDKKWDVFKKQLIRLSEKIDSEKFEEVMSENPQIGMNEEWLTYRKKIIDIIYSFEKEIASLGMSGQHLLQKANLTTFDFAYGKSSFATILDRAVNGDFTFFDQTRWKDAIDQCQKWYSKKSDKIEQITAVYPLLNPVLQQILQHITLHQQQYWTATAVEKNLVYLFMLNDIAEQIRLQCKENNVLTINEITSTIQALIQHTDAPFIYEKTGNRYYHFMLDEFQDTSQRQWNCFSPLIKNSLASGGSDLVVGDVKQSIYRWRNGNWKILGNTIEHEFSTITPAEIITLSSNYRSLSVIVEFNNNLFKTIPAVMTDRLEQIYGVSEQEIPIVKIYQDAVQQVQKANSGGYVQCRIIEASKVKLAEEQILQELPQTILQILSRGYLPKDIAILVREKKEGYKIIEAIQQYKQQANIDHKQLEIISQDTLSLNEIPVVHFIIAAYRLIDNPEDKLSLAQMQCYLSEHRQEPRTHDIFTSRYNEQIEQFVTLCTGLSLLEIFEQTLSTFAINTPENITFIQNLHAVILQHSLKNAGNIKRFLDYWNEKADNFKIEIPSEQNAITLQTIHKSKGLQYKIVIIPFCNWDLTIKKQSILWLSPTTEPFNSISKLPIEYNKSLLNTGFKESVIDELYETRLDNLNLLYVALTRAEQELYIFIPKKEGSTDTELSTIDNLLVPYFDTLPSSEKNLWHFGEPLYQKQSLEIKLSETICSYPSLPHISKKLHVKLVNVPDLSESFPKLFGTIMHKALQYITVPEDIPHAVERLWAENWIQQQNKKPLEKRLVEIVNHPQAIPFFDKKWKVLTEIEWFSGEEKEIIRPDRMMIDGNTAWIVDYKFGLVKRERDIQQMQHYVEVIKRSTLFTQIQSFIWYVQLNERIEING